MTPDVCDAILRRVAQGESVRRICRDAEFPHASTVYDHLWRDEDFARQYGRAKEAGVEAIVDEILEIADDGSQDTYTDDAGRERTNTEHFQRSKLRVDTRKWYAAKIAPKRFGEKSAADAGGKDAAANETAKPEDLSDDELARIATGGSDGAAAPPQSQD